MTYLDDLDPLDYAIHRENYRRIIEGLTPFELTIAWLRVTGHTDGEIAEHLHIDRTTVCHRMARAQQRLANQLPSAAYLLEGRQRDRRSRGPGDLAGSPAGNDDWREDGDDGWPGEERP
jgi:DNA-binding CsgD family transcriptional regulator